MAKLNRWTMPRAVVDHGTRGLGMLRGLHGQAKSLDHATRLVDHATRFDNRGKRFI